MSTGVFVVFEGGEGAGKSTQVADLARYLRSRGSQVVLTREPGGVPSAEAIRSILLDPNNDGLTDRAEALLFAAARAEHVAQLIRPALERGDVVICDRFIDSSVAYQGVARNLGVEQIADLSAWATDGLLPDLTIVLDIDPVDGLVRAGHTSSSPDRMESESLSFHQQVRQAFLDRAAASPQRYVVMDATLPADVVAQEISRAVTALIPNVS
ncbi:MAG: dTMP kinase [Candidatus Nanopelagicales bacterium]